MTNEFIVVNGQLISVPRRQDSKAYLSGKQRDKRFAMMIAILGGLVMLFMVLGFYWVGQMTESVQGDTPSAVTSQTTQDNSAGLEQTVGIRGNVTGAKHAQKQEVLKVWESPHTRVQFRKGPRTKQPILIEEEPEEFTRPIPEEGKGDKVYY